MPSARGEGDEPDWRRPETYAYTAALTRAGWAWEFLRRNPAFQADLARYAPSASTKEVSERSELKRWGICFRRHLGAGRDDGEGVLGPRALRECPAVDDGASIAPSDATAQDGRIQHDDAGVGRVPRVVS
jgi:hypothetical protein